MNLTRYAALLASLVLAACAQPPRAPDAAVKHAAEPAAKPLPKVVTRMPEQREAPLPAMELSESLLFKITLAEIAAQRGQPHVAVPAFLEAARETRDPRIARRATEIAWNARFLPAALEAATLWLQADPESRRARQTVIALLVNQSRLDDAQPHLEKWLAGDPENLGQNFLQLYSLLSGHKDKPAIQKLIGRLASGHAQVPEASLALAQAAWSADDAATALNASREALRLRPGWELAALFQAQALQRDSVDEAVTFLGDFIKAHPGARDARLNYARLLVRAQRYPEARKQFEILLGEAPNNAEIAMAVATLSMQAKDYAAADIQLRRALEIGAKDPDMVRMYLGQVNEELKRDSEALKWYSSITHGAQFIPAQARYAGVLARQGRLEDARKHLRGVSPGDARQRTQLTLAEAGLLRDAGAYKEAFDFLGEALARSPDSPDLLYDHAMAAEKVDRLDVLEANLRRLITLQPDHAHAHNALGYTLADRNQRLPEARALIETAHKLAPNDPFILDSLGWVLYRLGENEAALGHLRRAYEMRPDGEIAAHLGEVLWALGRRDEAQKVWAEALRAQPKNEVLQGTIKRLAPVVLQSVQ
ncbi:MAG: tetratricopeptide repeat protein [Burkholderiales bacterium]|jgi:tetratricopeptide (TPR) repeat protein|nr:tetratricopeptide repeat protein [Burkholderiales bacterium]